MPKIFTAPFAQDPRTADNVIVVALQNVATDAPTGAVLLATAGANGAIVPRLGAMPRATLATAVGLILYVSRDQGATLRPKGSVTMPAVSIANTAGLPETDFPKITEQRPLRLGPNERLYVGAMVAPPSGGIAVQCDVVDF